MTYVITQQCAGTCDTACVDVCPVDCIAGPVPLDELRAMPPDQRRGLRLYIDPDECVCCAGCEPGCPAQAIFLVDEVPATLRDDVARNAEFFALRRRRS